VSEIRTVLLDLDGTLADTAPDLAYALNRLREENGLAAIPYSRIRPVVSHGGTALIRFGFGLAPEHADFEYLRERLLALYRHNIARETTVFEGMDTVLDRLEADGRRWGVVTNKPGWLTTPLLAALDLLPRAACVVSGDTVARSKPHPDPLLHACELAGCDSAECVYVGDAERDIQAGRAAGMATLAAVFGYLGEEDRPETWGADALVETPGDILDWLDARNG
jgi:phosphoglycolate phosphatase